MLINYFYLGAELLKLNRVRIRNEFGVVRFIQQTEILQNINKLMDNSISYLPNKEDIEYATNINEWNTENIINWLKNINCTELIHPLEEINCIGEWILKFTQDDFCFMGLPPKKITFFICKLRKLKISSEHDELSRFYSKLGSNKKVSIPTLYDEAVDEWIKKLHLTPNKKESSSSSLLQLGTSESLTHQKSKYTLSPRKRKRGLSTNTRLLSPSTSDTSQETKSIQFGSTPSVAISPSSTTTTTDKNHIISRDNLKIGLLNGKRKSGKWKMRWYVLNCDNGFLYEYQKNSIKPTYDSKTILNIKPSRCISLTECSIRSVDFLVGRPNCFCVSKKNKIHLLLQAISPDASCSWTQLLMVSKKNKQKNKIFLIFLRF